MSSLLTLVSVSGLLDLALKSAAVMLLALVAAALLGRASAAWRHLVWCLSVVELAALAGPVAGAAGLASDLAAAVDRRAGNSRSATAATVRQPFWRTADEDQPSPCHRPWEPITIVLPPPPSAT